MKLREFLKNKTASIFGIIFLGISFIMLGYALKITSSYIIIVEVLMFMVYIICLTSEFYKRKVFYDDFLAKLEQLDQKYLITEMISTPDFREGQILYESLYEIDKAMKEKINNMEISMSEFKDYIEMWVHEMKIPISSLMLMNYNKNESKPVQNIQIKKMNYYVEQILFYARADVPEKDYMLKKCSLEAYVNKIILENKDLLIGNKIIIEKENLDKHVITDSKWFEFILNQIINNSIKYAKEGKGYIKFKAYETVENSNKKTILEIEDHGIGICESDISRVFEKTFTGKNGRDSAKSTGMGLFICKKLCDKLGHIFRIESKENEFTKVYLEFGKEDYYQM